MGEIGLKIMMPLLGFNFFFFSLAVTCDTWDLGSPSRD